MTSIEISKVNLENVFVLISNSY